MRECPDARKNCSTNFGTAECESTSGCQGGTGFPCAPGLTGTYCELCERPGGILMSYRAASDKAVAHCSECGDNRTTTILFGLGAMGALAVFVAIFLFIMSHLPKTVIKRIKYFNSTFTPKNKLKVRA